MSSTSAVAVLAQGLRELRDFAEGPDGEELRERTGLTTAQIDAALGGERLPTREVTLALVEAWQGDVEAWREYWGQIAELAEADSAGEADRGGSAGAATPAPPEPSIITPMQQDPGENPGDDAAEREAANTEAGTGAGAQVEPEAQAEAEAARARSAARARLEANAQAAKAHSEAMAAAAAQMPVPADESDEVGDGANEVGAGAGAEAKQAAASHSVEKTAQATGADTTSSPATVPQPTAVAPDGDSRRPPKKRPLARIGIPILLFAIGVGVGAFGDHALNSKQNSKNTSASLPPFSVTSSPSHSASLTASNAGATSSLPTSTPSSANANPTGSTSPTDASTTASTSATSTVAPGTVLGTYVGIQLASGYSVNFLADPYHPVAGTAGGPDTMGFFANNFVNGQFYADRAAILDPTDSGSFTSCLNDTRYQHDVLLSQLAANSSFCITTGTGHLVLVTVRRLPSSTDANPYAVLDVTVWQSS